MTKNEETNPATGHTPGPWKVSTIDGERVLMVGGGDDGSEIVADVRTGWYRNGFCVDEANARLMAAAPEMYEQLKALLEFADDIKEVYGLGSTWKNIRALVAKAEGGAS